MNQKKNQNKKLIESIKMMSKSKVSTQKVVNKIQRRIPILPKIQLESP